MEIKKFDVTPQPLPQVDWEALSAKAAAQERQEAAETIRRNLKESGAFDGDLENAGFENFMQVNGNRSQLTAKSLAEDFLREILTGKP